MLKRLSAASAVKFKEMSRVKARLTHVTSEKEGGAHTHPDTDKSCTSTMGLISGSGGNVDNFSDKQFIVSLG